MTPQTLINKYKTNKVISAEIVEAIQTDDDLRKNLVDYFESNKDRDFALALTNKFIDMRKDEKVGIPAEDLMLACYILGLHKQIEDCLKIWEAKTVDFDTYCGLDIQLVPFAGVINTLKYLKEQNTKESWAAIEYIIGCEKAGDFNDLKNYHPWFV